MSYVVDTNVLLRSIQKSHPMHKDADYAVKRYFEVIPEGDRFNSRGHRLRNTSQEANDPERVELSTSSMTLPGLAYELTFFPVALPPAIEFSPFRAVCSFKTYSDIAAIDPQSIAAP